MSKQIELPYILIMDLARSIDHQLNAMNGLARSVNSKLIDIEDQYGKTIAREVLYSLRVNSAYNPDPVITLVNNMSKIMGGE